MADRLALAPIELRIRAFALGIRVFGQHISGDFHHPDLRMREIEWHEEIRRVPWDHDAEEIR